ncbi:putative phthiocerol dimycocerosate transporter LppX [Mycobacterium kansasii]|uniref:Putative phthiocerol dimycocerosate transporter LppX n=1 Tax=Mycobacterium kansasii TaxID=1768 RepID=A0A7G1IIV4_MYCKA|nr:putative phthiocerol dimycocerosate transporter LppX [Mycobacterium kansasii]
MNDRKPPVTFALMAAVAAGLMLWLPGCAADKPESEAHSSVSTTSDPALVAEVKQSLEATKALTSVHLAIRTSGKVDSLLGITSADVDVRANPLAAKGVCTYQGQPDVPFRTKDDNISVKLFDDWTNLGSVSELAASRVVDPSNGVAKVLSGITNLQSQGSEVIDGIPTTKISGTVPTDTVKMLILRPGSRGRLPCGSPRRFAPPRAGNHRHRVRFGRADPVEMERTLNVD